MCRWIGDSGGAKTDRLDAEERWCGGAVAVDGEGDGLALRMVRVPSVADEDNREWQRERDRLMGEQRACVDRIVKKLRTQGVWIALDRRTRQQLRDGTLRCHDGQLLAPILRAALVIELDRVDAMQAKLKEWKRQQAELTPAAAERIRAADATAWRSAWSARGRWRCGCSGARSATTPPPDRCVYRIGWRAVRQQDDATGSGDQQDGRSQVARRADRAGVDVGALPAR